ncbi:acid phosphatase 1 [Morus notabilis]|uniref:acid phosphatase 1 n=1 Tax=Morus notabilis TaxID=981085 RepID=UPI000CECFAAA|nr:acid phosphatase 1 [Morus notabilis]
MMLFFFLAIVLAAKTAQADFDGPVIVNQIYLLRPQYGSGGRNGVTCLSWRFGVETNNIIDWETVPEECALYVGNYMLGQQYRQDSKAVVKEAYRYAKSLILADDGKDVWIFDIDETTLSNLPFYARYGFGVKPHDAELFNEWVLTESAPALPESLKLYKKLLALGIKIVFLTTRNEDKRHATEDNLLIAGYRTWEKIIFKQDSNYSITAVEYKSAERKKLEDAGYKIVGNIGDQWSDLLGTNTGCRTFKLPDPMYYVS